MNKNIEIIRIWQEELGVQDILPEDTFYSLGGTSLIAAKITARIRDAFNVPALKISDILLYKKPQDLIKAVNEKILKTEADNYPKETTRIPNSQAFATIQQQAIWFLEQMDLNNKAYNTITKVTFTGPLKIIRLERALSALIKRHKLLRTTFHIKNGKLFLNTQPNTVLKLDFLEIENENRDHYELKIKELGNAHFDISRLPLINWTVLKLAEDKHIFIQVEHHFIHDGWSTWILLRDLAIFYNCGLEKSKSKLPPIELQYHDFCNYQQKWLLKESLQKIEWWKQLIAPKLTIAPFLKNRRRPQSFTHKGDTVEISLNIELVETINKMSACLSVTPFSFLMAAFLTTLFQYTKENEIILGTMFRNRPNEKFINTIGMFVNTVAIPFKRRKNEKFSVFSQRVQNQLISAQQYGEVPFPLVTKALSFKRDLSRNAIFQVCFSMNDWPEQRLDFGPETSVKIEFPGNGGAKFDLDVVIADSQNYTFLWRYYKEIFSDSEIKILIDNYLLNIKNYSL